MKTGVKLLLVFGLAGCANGAADLDGAKAKDGEEAAGQSDAAGIESGAWPSSGPDAVAGDAEVFDAEAATALECDARFKFTPASPNASAPFVVKFTDQPAYAWVDLELSGPGAPSATWKGVSGDGPHTWSYQLTGHQPGVLELTFVKNKEPGTKGTTVGACELLIAP